MGNKTKKHKLLSFILTIIVASSFILPTISEAACTTVTECQAQLNQLNSSLTQTRAQQASARSRTSELQRIVNDLNDQIAATQAQIDSTLTQIDELNREIADLEAQIHQKEVELAIQKENQREAIRILYEIGDEGTISILLGHDSLSDAVTTTEYLDALEQKVEETITAIEELKKELNLEKQDLEGKRTVLNELRRTLEAQRAQLAEQRSLQQIALNDASANLAELNRQVNTLSRAIRAVDGSISSFLRSTFATATGEMAVINNGFHYYQWSEPWGSEYIYEDTMTESGCLITDIAMVSKMMGKNIGDPGQLLFALKLNGGLYFDLVAWNSGLSVSTGGLKWTRAYGANFTHIRNELAAGRPVIAQMGGWHWVVLTGYDARTGSYAVNDPYFTNRSYPASAVTGYVTVNY